MKQVELPGSDLSVSLGARGISSQATVTAGQELTYTLRYGNFGNQAAPTTTVTLSLGSGLTLMGAQPAPTRTATDSSWAGGVLGWDVGDIQVGASGVITALVRVASVPEDGSMALGTVRSGGREVAPVDNVVFQRWPAGIGASSVASRVYAPALMKAHAAGW